MRFDNYYAYCLGSTRSVFIIRQSLSYVTGYNIVPTCISIYNRNYSIISQTRHYNLYRIAYLITSIRKYIVVCIISNDVNAGGTTTITTVTSRRCSPDNVDDEDCGDNPERDDDDEFNSSGVSPFRVSSGGPNSSVSAIASMSSLPEAQATTVESQQQFSVSVSGGSTAHPSAAARGASSKRSGIDTGSGSSGEDPSSSPSTGRRSVSGGNGSTGSNGQMVVNISLIVGMSAGVVAALLLAGLAIYKYRSRDEGTYRLDPDARNGYTGYRPCTVTGSVAAGRANESSLAQVVGGSSALATDCIDIDDGCGSRSRSGSGSAGCGAGGTIYRLRTFRSRPKGRRDVKEWYV